MSTIRNNWVTEKLIIKFYRYIFFKLQSIEETVPSGHKDVCVVNWLLALENNWLFYGSLSLQKPILIIYLVLIWNWSFSNSNAILN